MIAAISCASALCLALGSTKIGVVGAQIFDWLVLSRPTDDPASARMFRIGVRF